MDLEPGSYVVVGYHGHFVLSSRNPFTQIFRYCSYLGVKSCIISQSLIDHIAGMSSCFASPLLPHSCPPPLPPLGDRSRDRTAFGLVYTPRVDCVLYVVALIVLCPTGIAM